MATAHSQCLGPTKEEEETFARGGFETRPHDDACVAAAKEGSASVGARHASPSSTGLLLLMQGRRMRRPYEEEETFARGGFEIRPHDDACVAAAKGGSASVGARHASPSSTGLLLLMQGDACVAPTKKKKRRSRGAGFKLAPLTTHASVLRRRAQHS